MLRTHLKGFTRISVTPRSFKRFTAEKKKKVDFGAKKKRFVAG